VTPGFAIATDAAGRIADLAGTTESGLTAAATAVGAAIEPPPLDPTMFLHLVSTLEGRLLLATMLALAAAGRASGLGGITFAQPMLANCRASVQQAFAPVKLIPCAAGVAAQCVAGAAGETFEGAGRFVNRIRSSSHRPPVQRVRTLLSTRAPRPSSTSVAGLASRPTATGQMLLRLVVSILAALSGLLATAAAVEREKHERVRQVYRRRLHS
jgi:hypothetical protein